MPIRKFFLDSLLALLAAIALSHPAEAAVTLADSPLFLTVSVTPNVVLTLDDSGSMARGYVPDSIGQSAAKLNGSRFSAATYNGIYYNPRAAYPVPTRRDGTTYATSFTTAYVNGFDTGRGSVNLGTNYRPITSCPPDDNLGSCSMANSPTSTASTTTPYSFTCRVKFNKRSRGDDSLDVSGCGTPFSGASQPPVGTAITVTGSSRNGVYTVSNVSAGDSVRVNETFSSDTTENNVTLAWSVTSSGGTTVTAAYYHLYYTDKPGATRPTGCNDSRETDACYLLILVGSSADIRTGTQAEQKQNFANWYSFYRTRALATMSGAMQAIDALDDGQVRLAWQTINKCTSFGTTCQGYDNANRENRIRTLTASHRSNFYNWLQRFDVSGLTPLRSTLERAGNYYTGSGVNSPYAQEPYVSAGTELACRKNFHILFTDGLWNSDSGTNFGGNVDSSSRTLPDNVVYSPTYPYANSSSPPGGGLSYSNSLADIAFKYWATDLRTGLGNAIPPYYQDRSGTAAQQYWNPKNDPATWQHMVNFTIGLGLGTTLTNPAWGGSTYTGDYPALATGTKFWPAIDETPTTNAEPAGHVYDLWHAAINSRGQFFSVEDPDSLSSAFRSALTSILNANPSSAAMAANSTSLQTGTLVYQARFDSADWHGQLLAFLVQGDGSIGSTQWDAATLIPAHAARNILTYDGSLGRTFSNCTTSLSAAQKLALDTNAVGTVDNRCTDRLAWLRGDSTKEVRYAGGLFRNRVTTVLGDIINSDPVYAHNEDQGYADASASVPERSSYAAYVTAKASRTPMVYVGANDGLLHGFRADTGNAASGRELFAYLPAGVYANLSKLTDPAYAHKYFVDGPPSVGDAYFSAAWKTVLVGGLGGGGKSVYALDISYPDSFSAGNVLWEYSDAADLGQTYSQPQIARLNDGQWAAVFGNGYNSTSDRAYLYVVRLSDGALITKIAAGSSTANGLSTPVLHDANNDKIIDAVYAGDLQGNLWKFDLSAASSAAWGLANGGSPLFTARNAGGQVQPIAAQPKVGGHPSGGVLVYFGTGRYLTGGDPFNTEVQSFYAIWDNGTAGTLLRGNLQAQGITAETSEHGHSLRETSNNTVDWAGGRRGWYLDLLPPAGAAGERVVSAPLLKHDRVIFVTLIPSTNQCVPGGESWVMELDMVTGGRTTVSSFDFNDDGLFDSADRLASGNAASGVLSTVGITKTPVWLEDSARPGIAYKELSGTSGNIMTLKNKGGATPAGGGNLPRRIYWQQIL